VDVRAVAVRIATLIVQWHPVRRVSGSTAIYHPFESGAEEPAVAIIDARWRGVKARLESLRLYFGTGGV
jgi:hypothetical protein